MIEVDFRWKMFEVPLQFGLGNLLVLLRRKWRSRNSLVSFTSIRVVDPEVGEAMSLVVDVVSS